MGVYVRPDDWESDPTKVDAIDPLEFDEVPETLTAVFDGPQAYTRKLRPGSILGEYRIERLLREGAMGRVYIAIQPEIGRRVAIKMLQADAATPDAVARFVDEARAVNRIAHPNVVDIYSLGRTGDGAVYLVMELLVGETLADRIARGPLAPAEARAILHQLTSALDAVHARGIVHRDVKPSNVFLVERAGAPPLVKLLDFGIAKLGDGARDREERGLVVGTPRYLAPEQARALAVDHRADIYALGGVAFELIVGRPPFLGESTVDVVAQQIASQPPRPSELVDDVPPDLDAIVFAMLAKRPLDRPPLAALRAVLDAIEVDERERAAGSTAELPVARTFSIGSRIRARGSRGLATLGAAAVLLVAAGILMFVQLRPQSAGSLVAAPAPSDTPLTSITTPPQPRASAPAAPPGATTSAIAVRDKHPPVVRRARPATPRAAAANATPNAAPPAGSPIAVEPLGDAFAVATATAAACSAVAERRARADLGPRRSFLSRAVDPSHLPAVDVEPVALEVRQQIAERVAFDHAMARPARLEHDVDADVERAGVALHGDARCHRAGPGVVADARAQRRGIAARAAEVEVRDRMRRRARDDERRLLVDHQHAQVAVAVV
jgi:hypothetical protein